MKIKKPTLSKSKKDAWEAYQHYKRRLWTLHGVCNCYTCDRVLTYEKVQCGHWVTGHGNVVYINDDYVRPQDFYCNIQLGGNQGEFRDRIRKELGDARVNQLLLESKQAKKISIQEYLDIESKYKKLLEELDA